jgi:hypothetical protein
MMEDLFIQQECATIWLSVDDDEAILTISNRMHQEGAGVRLTEENVIKLRNWLNEWLDKDIVTLKDLEG